MHVSGLLLSYFGLKTNMKVFRFLYQNMVGEDLRPCITVRFRHLNARSCMSQVLSHCNLIKKHFYKVIGFFKSKYGGEDLRHA